MSTLQLTGDAVCDDILQWLDAHSVSLTQGLPAQLLHRRWNETQRSSNELSAKLQRLFSEGLVSLTPGADTAHLRFTPAGYDLLLNASQVKAEPAPEALALALDPAPAPQRATPSALRSHLSETRLRNDLLGIYAELRLRADARLIGMTLSRYWQELGNRATDLRHGLDILTRDGFIESKMVGIDRHWMLTPAGERWIDAEPTPDCLLRRAPALIPVSRVSGPDAQEVQRLCLRLLAENGEPTIGYQELQIGWTFQTRLDGNALLLALDLLHKAHQVRFEETADELLVTVEAGAAGADTRPPRFGRLKSALHRILG